MTRPESTLFEPVNAMNKLLSNIPIPDGPDQVNTTHLERLMCFQTGFLPFSCHKDAATEGFFTTPLRRAGAFLPLKTVDHQHYKEHLEADDEEYVKAPILYELLTSHAKPIEVSSVVYDKPIAMVYNPVSGTQQDVREKILSTLEKHAIAVEIFETKYYLHAWDLAEKELVLAKYSAIAVVGGDGLFHEVVNGLMKRKQHESILPVAFLPNGTGNDTVANFGVNNLEQALDFLIQGDTIKMDCNLLTLDASSYSEVPIEEWRDRVRYSIGSSAVGFIAHVNKKATFLKRYVGGLAYVITGLKELLLNFGPHPKYGLEIEQPSGSKIHLSITTLLLFINNGKYAGGHINFTPAAILNDGLLDIIYKEGSFNVVTGIKFLDQAKNPRLEAGQVFRNDTTCLRAKSVVVHADCSADTKPHLLQIDGESLEFNSFVKVEAVPEAIDVIVDARTVLAPMLPPRFLPLCLVPS